MTNFHTMCQSQMPVDHLKHNFSQFQHKTVCCCCLFQGEQAKDHICKHLCGNGSSCDVNDLLAFLDTVSYCYPYCSANKCWPCFDCLQGFLRSDFHCLWDHSLFQNRLLHKLLLLHHVFVQ